MSNFGKWVDTYVCLKPLGITSEELWEFRNSLLHMTNLKSRKVVAGTVSPIMPFVSISPATLPIEFGLPKPFNLKNLIDAVAAGICIWGATYNSDLNKLITFVERYDTTISDSRMAWIPLSASV